MLQDIHGLISPEVRKNTEHSYHLYVIRTDRRDELKSYLSERGIETAIHYPVALPNMVAYQYLGYSRNDFPIASNYENKILSLPIYPEMTNEQIKYVCNCIKSFYSGYSK